MHPITACLIRSIRGTFENESEDEKPVHVCQLRRHLLLASQRLRPSLRRFIWDASQISGALSETCARLPGFQAGCVMHRPIRATLTGCALAQTKLLPGPVLTPS